MVWHHHILPANSVVWPIWRVDSGCARRRQRNSSSHESVVQQSTAMLSRLRPRTYGTVYHQAWHHRRVFAWKLSCSRDATVLTKLDILSTFITYFIDCMLRALEVSLLYVTLITFDNTYYYLLLSSGDNSLITNGQHKPKKHENCLFRQDRTVTKWQ